MLQVAPNPRWGGSGVSSNLCGFPGRRTSPQEAEAGVGGALCIPGALGVYPVSGLSPTTAAASCSHVPRASLGDPTRAPRKISMTAGAGQVSDRVSSGFPGRRASPQLRAHRGRRGVVSPRQRHTRIVNACASSRSCSVRPGPPRYGHGSWVLTGTAWISRVAAAHLHGRYWVRREPGGRVLCGGRCLNSLSGQSVPPTHPARWSRWDRALLDSLISLYAERSLRSLAQRS